jgi:hypothetical protein
LRGGPDGSPEDHAGEPSHVNAAHTIADTPVSIVGSTSGAKNGE